MKKLLILFVVLALTLGAMTSCDFINGIINPTPVVEETNIEEAVKELDDMYAEKNGTATENSFTLVAQLLIDGTVFTINWTSDNENVTVTLDDGEWIVGIPESVDEQFEYHLTATITTEGGQSATIVYNRVVPGGIGVISNPVVGTAYKFALLHGNEKAVVYFNGNNYNGYAWYLEYSTDVLSAVDVYLEAVEGVEDGYRLYFDKDGAKTYIVAFPRDGDTTKGTLKLDTEVPAEYYTWNTDYNTLVYTSVTGEQFYIGSSGTYKSISLSAISYIGGATSYVAHLYGEGGVKEELPKQELPEVPDPYTSQDIVDALYKLESGQTLEGPYEITGVITSFKYAYDPGYNNVSVNIVVEGREDKPVLCYRLNGGEELKVGDTITVFAGVTNYNGTYETVSGGVIRNVIPGEGGGEVVPPVDSDGVEINLTGNANLVSGSADQNVFTQNGITVTNDKAESTSDLTVQESYAQRFYAKSTVKIEYPGMTKIVIDCDEYSDLKYVKGFDGMTIEGATITRDNDIVTIIFAAPTDVFQSTALSSQIRCEKITVYTGEVETPVIPDPKPDDPTYTAPVAGQAYDLYMELPTGKVYFAGSMSGDYLATTTDAAASVKIFFEEVAGGYHIYFMNGDVKTYITAAAYLKSNGYAGCHFSLTTETPTLAWTYDTKYGIIEIYDEIEGKSDTFFAGTYGTYSTVSLSGAYYKDQISSGTQFPARIEGSEGSGSTTPDNPQPPVHEHTFVEGKCECGETDPNYQPPTGDKVVLTIPEALALATKQGDSYTSEKYYITGVVTNISNTFYGNFYIVDAEGNELYVYGLKDSTGAGNFESLNPQPAVGDTLTIYTVLGCYKGSPQAKDAWFSELVKHTEHTWEDATCKAAKTCSICGKTEGEPLEHNYVDGACTLCGKSEPVQGTVITSTENFAGLTASGSYKTVTTTSGWTAVNAAVLTGGANDSNPVFKFIGDTADTVAIAINGKTAAAGKITSATLSNGISKLSFNYGNAFSESKGVDITINILKNGEVVATTRLDNDSVSQKTAYDFTWELDNVVEGDFVIEILNNSPSNSASSNKDRVAIFNLSWDSAPIVEG